MVHIIRDGKFRRSNLEAVVESIRLAAAGGCMALGLVVSGCAGGSGSEGSGDGAEKKSLKVAVLAASAQNGYNQAVFQGVKEGAERLGLTVDAQILDGQFDANTQLSQLQNATTTGGYDGIIVVPQDGPVLGAAFPLAQSIPVVSVLNPIGSDIEMMEPQVEGVVSTVAVAPSVAAKKQAEQVVEYCKDKSPCKVGVVVGLLNSPLDVARSNAYKDVLSKHSNIQIVGTVEGSYDRDKSLSAVSNMLQGNKDINAILSNADQQTLGAQIALENAGISPSSVFLTGGGGTKEAVKAVRDGLWTSDYLNFPVSMGAAAIEQLSNAINGKDVKAVVDADTLGPIDPYAYKEDLDKAPDFTGEWNG
ncbi:sugar ABC transporter substrate-binding protein [Arthrobacter sp. UNC362MFTsu5.1]|uniref:sugar ABC transporter substrate-binding protein n=1 Tax=Arthrobacter sp. UNC362MFTsu5.1 TaxID=1449044 RepID=UPI0018CC0AC1|nr:sugar ABC transporter substrate-binding protein [Arthrobacter sp. UNC362MFTsu5.1]